MVLSQGAKYSDYTIDSNGHPLAGVQVRVCATSSPSTPPPTSACTPLATLYTDETLVLPSVNPVTSDAAGNFSFFAPTGFYILQFYQNGTQTFAQTVQVGTTTTNTVFNVTVGFQIAGSFGSNGQCITSTGTGSAWGTCGGGEGGGGITTLNPGTLTGPTVTLATDATGTDFGVAGVSNVITISLPTASATSRGALSSADWSTFNAKQAAISVTSPITLAGASIGMVNQGTTTTVLHGNAAGNASFAAVTSADTLGTFPPATHNLLSAVHSDTTTVAATRGDMIAAVGASTTWQRVAHSSIAGGYWKWNGTDVVASSGAASGTGSPTACSNQFVTTFILNADGSPTSTCTTDVLASAQHANQGTTTTVLHGNAAGNPSWAAVTSADTTGTFPANAHNLLSATHGDTTPAAASVGALITGQTGPVWASLAPNATTTKKYLQSVSSGTASWQQVAYADLSGTPALFYQTVQDEGSDLPQEPKLNFTGAGVTCSNNAGVATNCDITSGGGTSAAGATLFSTTTLTGPSNTTTETSLLSGTGISGSKTIAANTFLNGTVMQVELGGFYSTPAVTVDNLTLRVKCGSTVLASKVISGLVVAATNQAARLYFYVHAIGSGASGSLLINTIAEFTGTTLTPSEAAMVNTSAVAYDFTTSCAFDVTAQWAGAQAGESISVVGAAWIPGAPVTSVNGQTGAVSVATGAATSDSFVTLAHDADLTAERVLIGTAGNISVTDGGANNNVTLDLINTGTAGTYTKVTTDAKGRVTVGTAATLASADFSNQGTTTTVLHGNAAGNPSWTSILTADAGTNVHGNATRFQLSDNTGLTRTLASFDANGNVTGGNGGDANIQTPEMWGAKADVVILTDGAITTGTAAYASASAVFTANDVGKAIVVRGAAASGNDLVSTILTFTNSTHVVLNNNAGTTVSGALTFYGTDDYTAINTAVCNGLSKGGKTTLTNGKIYMVSNTASTINPYGCGNNPMKGGTMDGEGTVIFAPQGTLTAGTNDRFLYIASNEGNTFPIVGGTGNSFTIAASPTGATMSGTTATITTTATCNVVAGARVNILGVGISGYNGNYTAATGCGGGTTFTYLPQVSVVSESESGTTATAVTLTSHNFTSGQSVVVAGASVGGYNGTFTVTVTGANTFTYTTGAGLGASTGGTATSSGLAASGAGTIGGAINKGDTGFIANTADIATAGLTAGDFIIITEREVITTTPAYSDVAYVDWMQVSSIAGSTVNFPTKFRMAFPNARTYTGTPDYRGLSWRKIGPITSNLTFQDFTLIIPKVFSTNYAVGFGTRDTRGVTIKDITCTNASANCFAGYLDQGLKFNGNNIYDVGNAASEFAAEIDWHVEDNVMSQVGGFFTFYAPANAPATVGSLIDYGSAFGVFKGNTISDAFGGGMNILVGVHDNTFQGNTIGWVQSSGGAFYCKGCYRNTITGNVLTGGDASATGITFGDFTAGVQPIRSDANVAEPNIVNGFQGTNAYSCGGTTLGTDTCVASPTSGTGISAHVQIQGDSNAYNLLELRDNGAAFPRTIAIGPSVGGGGSFGIRDNDGAKNLLLMNWTASPFNATLGGRLNLPASVTAGSSLNIPSGTAPTTPVAGDIWHDANGFLFVDATSTQGSICPYDSTGAFSNCLTSAPTANRTTTFPDNTGTVAELNLAQTWTATQTFQQPANKTGQASITAASAAINTTETVIVKTPALPANRLIAGTVLRVILVGTCTSTVANTSTFALRYGTNGTTADGLLATGTVTAAASGTTVPFKIIIDLTVRTTGASATGFATYEIDNNGTTGIAAVNTTLVNPTMSAFNTTTANAIISATYKTAATTTTSTFQQAWIEVVYQ